MRDILDVFNTVKCCSRLSQSCVVVVLLGEVGGGVVGYTWHMCRMSQCTRKKSCSKFDRNLTGRVKILDLENLFW